MKRRNAPGEGSITKRKSDGLYMIRWPRPGQPPGCEYARTLREAQQKLRAAITRRDAGLPEPDRKLTVEKYLKGWLEHTARPNVKPSTYSRHERQVHSDIIPALGHHLLVELTPQHVRKLQSDLLKMQAPSTVARMRAVLVAALEVAVRDGILQRNVASLVDRPRVTHQRKPGLPIEHAQRLLQAIQGSRYEALIAVTLCFGLRRGEALGLRWEDVDIDKGLLHITGQMIRLKGHPERVGYTKGGKHRTAPIPTPLVMMLKAHRQAQRIWKAAHGDVWQEYGLVFPTRVGTPMDPGRFNRLFTRILAQAGLPHYTVHDLRHSAVSLLRALHVPDSVIMSVAGHANLAQTHYYGDILPDLQTDALDKMGGLLFGTKG